MYEMEESYFQKLKCEVSFFLAAVVSLSAEQDIWIHISHLMSHAVYVSLQWMFPA